MLILVCHYRYIGRYDLSAYSSYTQSRNWLQAVSPMLPILAIIGLYTLSVDTDMPTLHIFVICVCLYLAEVFCLTWIPAKLVYLSAAELYCRGPNLYWMANHSIVEYNSGIKFYSITLRIPDTYEAKNSKNMQLLEVLACNSANKQSFSWITGQNVQKLPMIFAS